MARIALISMLLLLGIFPAAPAARANAQSNSAVTDLWLDLRILHQPLVDLFNDVATEQDIARVEHVNDLALLDGVRTGRKLIVFRSVAEAEQDVPRIASRVDIIGYNLENRAASPGNERSDPLASAQRMRALADEYDLLLAFGPDHDFALEYGVDIAPYVDIFVLQIQLAQTQPQAVYEFLFPLIPELREANPDLEISVQIRTEGDIPALVELVDSIRVSDPTTGSKLALDGVSILSRRDTVPVADALIHELRNSSPARPSLSERSFDIFEDKEDSPDRDIEDQPATLEERFNLFNTKAAAQARARGQTTPPPPLTIVAACLLGAAIISLGGYVIARRSSKA